MRHWNKLICARMIKCVKSVRIQSYSGPYLPSFRLNTERYFVSLSIQSECGKIRTRITPNIENIYAVIGIWLFVIYKPFFQKWDKIHIGSNEVEYICLMFSLWAGSILSFFRSSGKAPEWKQSWNIGNRDQKNEP